MLSSPHQDIESMAWGVSASHTLTGNGGEYAAFDGNMATRWELSGDPDPDLWVDIDLRYLYDIVGKAERI